MKNNTMIENINEQIFTVENRIEWLQHESEFYGAGSFINEILHLQHKMTKLENQARKISGF